MKTRKFEVNVVGYNADTFHDNYEKFIVNTNPTYFGDMEFTLIAPQEVYDEISGLTEEGIEIL